MSTFTIVLAVLLFVVVVIRYMLHVTHDSKEPTIIQPNIPFVGHLWGLYAHGVDFFTILRDTKWLSIYSLDILSIRVYVVNCPKIASAIQKCDKTLSFYPVITSVSERLLKLDKEDLAKIEDSGKQGIEHFDFMADLKGIHHRVLGLGSSLNQIRNETLKSLAETLNHTAIHSSEEVDLFAWSEHLYTIAAVSAIWGPTLSFSDDENNLEKAFWTVEGNLAKLMANIIPKFTASSSYQARSTLHNAFLKYYRSDGNGNENAPNFVQSKKALAQKYSLSDHYNSRADVGELLAMLVNVVPVSFWLLIYIFSSPSLLADVRAELQHLTVHEEVYQDNADSVNAEQRYLDVSQIQSICPLLYSTWQEVLRIVSVVTTSRCVIEDTYIGDNILLKKGGIVQIPTGALHTDRNLWGPDVNEFDPRRFLKSREAQIPSAFRPFGGGSTMCPGRYLAVTEILGFVSAFTLGFDMSPVDGKWKLPKRDSRPFPGTVKPASDIKVAIKRRVGFEKITWGFKPFDV